MFLLARRRGWGSPSPYYRPREGYQPNSEFHGLLANGHRDGEADIIFGGGGGDASVPKLELGVLAYLGELNLFRQGSHLRDIYRGRRGQRGHGLKVKAGIIDFQRDEWSVSLELVWTSRSLPTSKSVPVSIEQDHVALVIGCLR